MVFVDRPAPTKLPPAVDYVPSHPDDFTVPEGDEPEPEPVKKSRSGRTVKRKLDQDYIHEFKQARKRQF